MLPDPLSPLNISVGIATNIATEMLKHYSKYLDKTKVAPFLRKIGILEATFEEQLVAILSETVKDFADANPNYCTVGLIEFISDHEISTIIIDFILNKKIINQEKIVEKFKLHLHPIDRLVLKKRGLEPQIVIDEFFISYRKTLLKHLDVPTAVILSDMFEQTDVIIKEIQSSEDRIKNYLNDLLSLYFIDNKLLIEPGNNQNKEIFNKWNQLLDVCHRQLCSEINRTIGKKYIPTLYVERKIEKDFDKFTRKNDWIKAEIVQAISSLENLANNKKKELNNSIISIENEILSINKVQNIVERFPVLPNDDLNELWRNLEIVINFLDSTVEDTVLIRKQLDNILIDLDSFLAGKEGCSKIDLDNRFLSIRSLISKQIFKQKINLSLRREIKQKEDEIKRLRVKINLIEELQPFNKSFYSYFVNNDYKKFCWIIKDEISKLINNVYRIDDKELGQSIRILSVQITKIFQNCFLIVDRAGSGKTNLLCNLAYKYSKTCPVIFLSGKTSISDEFGLENYIIKSLKNAGFEFNNLEEISDLITNIRVGNCGLDRSDNNSLYELVIIIDGINENQNGILFKRALEKLIYQNQDKNIIFCVSCRDIYWDYLKDNFWDEVVFKEIHGHLYNFSKSEYKLALNLYLNHFNISCKLKGDALRKCRHPLLLRFFCEAYGNTDGINCELGGISEIRLKKLFDDYWERKITNTKQILGYRTGRDIEKFLYSLAFYMRSKHSFSIPLSIIQETTEIKDLESEKSIYIRTLDEDIILEQNSNDDGNQQIVFVYDAFMEYTIAREIVEDYFSDPIKNLSIKHMIKNILKEQGSYKSVFGIVSFLCVIFAVNRKIPIWQIVLDEGKEWHLSIVLGLSQLTINEFDQSAFECLYILASSINSFIQKQVLIISLRLRNLNEPKLLQVWEKLFYNSSSKIRILARREIVRLAQKGDHDAIRVMLEALKSPDSVISACALFGLYEINIDISDKLRSLSSSKDIFIRQAVAYNAKKYPKAKNLLMEFLYDEDENIRIQACQGLKNFIEDDVIGKIKGLAFADPSFEVRNSVERFLKKAVHSYPTTELKDLLKEINLLNLEKEIPFYYYDLYDLLFCINDKIPNQLFEFESNKLSDDDIFASPLLLSLDMKIYRFEIDDKSSIELGDYLFYDEEDNFNCVSIEQLHEDISKAIEVLPIRERMVLQLRYGLSGDNPLTLEKVGRKMGLSGERIRLLEAQALSRLRHPAIRRKLRDYLT